MDLEEIIRTSVIEARPTEEARTTAEERNTPPSIVAFEFRFQPCLEDHGL